MRVGFVFNHAGIVGGGEISFIDLIDAVQALGVQPIGIVPRPEEVSERLDALEIETAFVPWPSLRGWRLFAFGRVSNQARLLFEELDLDLVHINGARSMLYAGWAARRAGIPCLWHVRVLERDWILDRVRSRLASAIVANSRSVAETLAKLRPSPVPLHTIYNGVRVSEISACHPRDIHRTFSLPDAPVVLAVGRVTREKGYEDLIGASASMHRDGVRHSVVVVGRPADGLYSRELKTRVKDLSLSNWTWAGQRDDVPDLMQTATVLALPSHREGFSRVILEAWACGLPVVATRQGGPAELIRNNQDGLLVESHNPAALATDLARILSDQSLRNAIASRGKERVQDFSLARHAQQVVQVYREMIP